MVDYCHACELSHFLHVSLNIIVTFWCFIMYDMEARRINHKLNTQKMIRPFFSVSSKSL